MQRWNRLSRLQRSLIYAVVIVTVTILLLLYTIKVGVTDIEKTLVHVSNKYEYLLIYFVISCMNRKIVLHNLDKMYYNKINGL